jgi:hypothetical protein
LTQGTLGLVRRGIPLVEENEEGATWRELYAPAPLRDVDFVTLSGLPLEPVC